MIYLHHISIWYLYDIYIYIYIYISSYFCGVWAFCVSWVTSDQFYYALCLTCWARFGSLVPVICNHTSSALRCELPWGHWRLAIVFLLWLCIYIRRFRAIIKSCKHKWSTMIKLITKIMVIVTKRKTVLRIMM